MALLAPTAGRGARLLAKPTREAHRIGETTATGDLSNRPVHDQLRLRQLQAQGVQPFPGAAVGMLLQIGIESLTRPAKRCRPLGNREWLADMLTRQPPAARP